MATRKDKMVPAAYRSAGSAKSQKGSDAFDLWLHRGLHQMFDDVANEPVPEDLLRLIQDDRDQQGPPPADETE